MKIYVYTLMLLLLNSTMNAQVLWSEDFDSYNTGNLGTVHSYTDYSNLSPNPPVPGQGDWFVIEYYFAAMYTNYYDARIEPEAGRGNLLTIEDIPQPYNDNGTGLTLSKVIGTEKAEGGIESLWNGRDAGNDILKFEYDFYTGNIGTSSEALTQIRLNKAENFGFNLPINQDITFVEGSSYWHNTLGVPHIIRQLYVGSHDNHSQLADNTWYSVVLYIDYTTNNAYLVMPSINYGVKSRAASGRNLLPVDNIMITFRSSDIVQGNNRTPIFCKYDNLKMSAVSTLPLSIEKLAVTTFNVFPNPAADIVTVTNSENIGIETLTVYDLNGKIVKSQKGSNENEVQLHIGNLAQGTYFLHIQTREGTAVEKIVKK